MGSIVVSHAEDTWQLTGYIFLYKHHRMQIKMAMFESIIGIVIGVDLHLECILNIEYGTHLVGMHLRAMRLLTWGKALSG
jgi:hypothetical protein